MSHTPESPHSFSPFWALLLLPAGLGIGWLVGKLPTEAAAPAPLIVRGSVVAASAQPATDIRPDVAPAAPSMETAPSAPEAESKPEDRKPAQQFSQWTSYEGALAESERTGKPILLDFNADWCPPCQALKREVFEDGGRGRAVQTAVIPVSIVDRRRESGSNSHETESLQGRYGIEAFPTLVVFHPRTGRVQQRRGFGDADASVQWIQYAAGAVK